MKHQRFTALGQTHREKLEKKISGVTGNHAFKLVCLRR